MTVKENIKKRRIARIKAILAEPRQPDAAKSGAVQPRLPQTEDSRLSDPEYVWNLRRKQFGWDEDRYERDRAEEERSFREWMAPPSKTQLGGKIFICALLFFGIWALFRAHIPGTDAAKAWVTRALTEDLDTAAVALWYERTFSGFPAVLPALQHNLRKAVKVFDQDAMLAPTAGHIVRTEEDGPLGVWVHAPDGSAVQAVEEGRVVYAGRLPETGLTVRVQHAKGWVSTYGWLAQTNVSVNDWIRKGDSLGTVAADGSGRADQANFYFSLAKDRQPIPPTDVIPFD
ncbi:MAG TPA: M23 family metallopeptidase [Bacilli bacterium]